jgi:hypothetical protein
VLDAHFVANGPQILVSASQKIKCKLEMEKKYMYHKTMSKWEPKHVIHENEIEFGKLLSQVKLSDFVRAKKKINITETRYGKSGYYEYLFSLETYIPKTNTIRIASDFNEQSGILSLHIHYVRNIGVGDKIADVYGQKAIIASIADLSVLKNSAGYWPQLILSENSSFARSQSASVLNCLKLNTSIKESESVIAPHAIRFINRNPETLQAVQHKAKIDPLTCSAMIGNGLNSTQLNFYRYNRRVDFNALQNTLKLSNLELV